MSTALILGCGPSGLLAAHSLAEEGYDIRIVSKKRKSEMFGAQYLHRAIPSLGLYEDDGVQIAYLLSGSIQGYRDKVYGENWSGQVSPDEYGDEADHRGWDIRLAYNRLWSMYGDYVENVEFPHGTAIQDYIAMSIGIDIVVSSLPAPAMCLRREQHVFNFQGVYAIGDAPERGVFCPVQAAPENTVLCNGEPDVGWYRTAKVFGYRTAEWPWSRRPPYDGVAEVAKPLNTTCDCQPDVIRVGRYGKWQKGVLAHEAYEGVKRVF